MMIMLKVSTGLLALASLVLFTGSAVSAPDLMGSYSDWRAYRHVEGGELMCFAVSGASEDGWDEAVGTPPRIYVTSWPNAGVKAEISVLLAFEPSKGSKISLDVDGTTFTLFADADRAYVGDPDAELRLLEAMRRGRTLSLTMPAPPGADATADFSLSGLTASVQAIATSCR